MNLSLILAGVTAAACLLLLHRVALWAETRGWIYYHHRRATSSSASNAFLQVQAIFEPAAEHAVEQRRQDQSAAAEDAGAAGGRE